MGAGSSHEGSCGQGTLDATKTALRPWVNGPTTYLASGAAAIEL